MSSDLINRLKGGKTLHIDFQADGALSSVDLPLTGLAASFLYADDQQDRVGHIDALTAKGDKPAAQAPPLRQFNAVAELPEQLQAVYGKGGLCYLPDETDFVELGAFVHQLTPNKAIYALPCETGYNASFLIYSRVDEKFQQMQFGSVGEESYAANLRYDWRKKTFTTHFKVSGSGNCAYDSALMLEDKPHVLSLKWIKRTETEGCAGN